MAHTPLKMSIDQTHAEVNHAWTSSYSPEAIARAVESIRDKGLGYRINILIARLCFRGIYFPQLGKRAWLKIIFQNRRTILKLVREAAAGGSNSREMPETTSQAPRLDEAAYRSGD
jgi:hypothetical protein